MFHLQRGRASLQPGWDSNQQHFSDQTGPLANLHSLIHQKHHDSVSPDSVCSRCLCRLRTVVFDKTPQTQICGEPASNTETARLLVTFKDIKIRRGCSCRRRLWERGEEMEVQEEEEERAEGGRKVEGFVLGMPGRGWRRQEELEIHRGEDFSATSAPADSCRQEFRSSFCHRAYARSSVTKTHRSAAAA